jgi:hypothetical protein
LLNSTGRQLALDGGIAAPDECRVTHLDAEMRSDCARELLPPPGFLKFQPDAFAEQAAVRSRLDVMP